MTSPLRFTVLFAFAQISASPATDASEGAQLARLSAADPVLSAPGAKTLLSERAALLYREIFDLKEQGAGKAADVLLARLGGDTLLGQTLHLPALDLPLESADHLRDPETAITFGQAYLQELLNRDGIGDNLMFIAAGNHAGPGRILQWRGEFGLDHDPPMFLEMIPFVETRVYVKKVLANLWSYRARLGQLLPSLEAMAANTWPSYRAFDGEQNLCARRRTPS
jgi:hypothetical protein